jgi:hypothetical protein
MRLKTDCGQGADGVQWDTSSIWTNGHREGIHCAGKLYSSKTEVKYYTFSERDKKWQKKKENDISDKEKHQLELKRTLNGHDNIREKLQSLEENILEGWDAGTAVGCTSLWIGAAPLQGEANATNTVAEEVRAHRQWGMVLYAKRGGNWQDKIVEEIASNADVWKGRAKWPTAWVAMWDGGASLQHPQSYAWPEAPECTHWHQH